MFHLILYQLTLTHLSVSLGALGAYLIGKVQLNWTYYGDIFTAFCSILMGVFMMSCYFFEHIQLIYLSYILYGLVSEAILVITL